MILRYLLLIPFILSYTAHAEEPKPSTVEDRDQPAADDASTDSSEKSPVSVEQTPVTENEQDEIDRFQHAKVFSCAIDFPLNGVQFNEKRLEDCFTNIKRERISYIHVIATATLAGSYDHNLFLSTRRAGAIEGYLKNHFPEVTVHAFGGGRNPKFGKSARIFIVESPENPDQETPEQKVVVEQYPQIKVEYKTEYKYLPPKRLGLNVQALGGAADFNKSKSDVSLYQYLGIAGSYETTLPYMGRLGNFAVGMRYVMNRANSQLDIHEGSFILEKMFKLPRWVSTGEFSTGLQGLAGAEYQNTVDPTYGGVGLLRYKIENYTSAFNVGYSKHFKWLGLEMGVLL